MRSEVPITTIDLPWIPADQALDNTAHFLALAQATSPPQRYAHLLTAADLLLRGQLTGAAETLLNSIPDTSLPPSTLARKRLLKATLAWQQHTLEPALTQLNRVSLSELAAPFHPQYHALRTQILQAGPLTAAHLQATLNYTAECAWTEDTPRCWKQWQRLNAFPTKMTRPDNTNAWWSLNQLAREPKYFPTAFTRWQQQHPRSLARAQVPGTFSPKSAPKNIAVLLPLTGPHAAEAQTIREGILAAYYQSPTPRPQIAFYDTGTRAAARLYKEVVAAGADAVIGPLIKTEVKSVFHYLGQNPTVPTITLNQVDDRTAHRDMLQLGLSPITEVVALAQRLWESGYTHPGILFEKNPEGERLAHAFDAAWTSLGGYDLKMRAHDLSQDPAVTVRAFFHIDASQARFEAIRQRTTQKVEFQPRRRQDLDAMVLLVSAEQARRLKPLFDFYYAETLPVYAMSSIYGGRPSPGTDRDLNGIIFCDIPWLLDPQHMQAKLLPLFDAAADRLVSPRLFALGIDAYQLLPHFERLRQFPMLSYPGTTGFLTAGPTGQIERQLLWAMMVQGATQR